MDALLNMVDEVVSYGFYVFSTVMLYISVKKCFWDGKKSRVILFILSTLTNPVLSLFASVMFGAGVISPIVDDIAVYLFRDIVSSGKTDIVVAITTGVFYVLVIFFFAWIFEKWLGTKKYLPMLFLHIMFGAINITATYRDADSGLYYASSYGGSVANIVTVLFMFFGVLMFYFLDVKPFSGLSRLNVKVNWKIFIIPPTIYTLLFGVLASVILMDSSADSTTLILFCFFTVLIVFLFIWAFHVIVGNINANNEIKTLSVEVMEALAHTIDAKDEYTRGHSVRVAKYSRMLAQKLGLSEEDCDNVYYMGLLHDIGKIGVPNAIINSKSKLTDEEYAVIKTHPGVGFDILAEIKSRPDLSIGARWHHERYDGKGYPDKKAGEEIPYFARIIAVADTYDAMTSNRSYRNYLPQDVVRSEIEKNMGTQFDPKVAKCMIELIDEDKAYVMHE